MRLTTLKQTERQKAESGVRKQRAGRHRPSADGLQKADEPWPLLSAFCFLPSEGQHRPRIWDSCLMRRIALLLAAGAVVAVLAVGFSQTEGPGKAPTARRINPETVRKSLAGSPPSLALI